MKTIVIICLTVICLQAGKVTAATNTPPATNKITFTKPVDIAWAKSAAIIKLNKFFTIERDFVENFTKIKLKEPMSGDGVKIQVMCFLHQGDTVPSQILMRFESVSRDWQFLKNSRLAINYDGKMKVFSELEVNGDVLRNASVSEIMVAQFDYDEFRSIAYAKEVGFNLGAVLKNNEFTPTMREEWKALYEYFAVLKLEKESGKEVKPAPVTYGIKP